MPEPYLCIAPQSLAALTVRVTDEPMVGEYANREQREQIYEEAKGLTPRRLSKEALLPAGKNQDANDRDGPKLEDYKEHEVQDGTEGRGPNEKGSSS